MEVVIQILLPSIEVESVVYLSSSRGMCRGLTHNDISDIQTVIYNHS
jgi:hypothetical protein